MLNDQRQNLTELLKEVTQYRNFWSNSWSVLPFPATDRAIYQNILDFNNTDTGADAGTPERTLFEKEMERLLALGDSKHNKTYQSDLESIRNSTRYLTQLLRNPFTHFSPCNRGFLALDILENMLVPSLKLADFYLLNENNAGLIRHLRTFTSEHLQREDFTIREMYEQAKLNIEEAHMLYTTANIMTQNT
jgi:hypothetical protein